MVGNLGKYSILLVSLLFLISFSTAAELATLINQETGLNSVPYEDGDTVQGTANVQWTEDDPDNVLPCEGCTGPTELKWQIWMTYKDSNGNQYTEKVGETSFGPGDSRKEGDNIEETVNSVTISTEHNVDTTKYNMLAIKPVLSPTSGVGTDEADDLYLMSQEYADGGNSGGSGNNEPVPRLDIPSEVQQGDSFTADASDSYDTDGNIEMYDFDWTDDGNYETFGGVDYAVHTYTSPGEKTVRLRVEDDQGAQSSVTKTIEVTQDCPQKMVGDIELSDPVTGNDFELKAAFWELSATGSYTDQRTDCKYNHASPNSAEEYVDFGYASSPVEAVDTPPMVFNCVNGTTNELASYPDPDDDELSASEQNFYFDAEQDAIEYCQSQVSESAFNHTGETVPMVQYYVPTPAIPYGAEGSSYVATTGSNLGLKTHTFSDLYRAMTRYDQDDSIWTCGECENETTWLNKNMSQTSAYNNPDPDKDGYRDAWSIDNMGGGSDPNFQDKSPYDFMAGPDKKPQSSDVFPGGFGGNCQGILTWQYTRDRGRWLCDSSVPITQEIFMPTLDFPGDVEADMVRVGFFIMPQLFKSEERSPVAQDRLPLSLTQSTDQSLIENQTIQQVNAMCWWGDNDRFRDLQYENVGQTWFTVSYRDIPTDFDNPLPVQGELNRTLKSEYGATYSCKWTLTADPAVKFSDLNVDPDTDSKPFDVYTTTGRIEQVGSSIQDYVENRSYTSDSINLDEEFRSPMNEDKFADVAFEWQSEIGYNRYDSSIESDQRLDCRPDQPPFSSAEDVPACTGINLNWYSWRDLNYGY